MKQTYEIGIDPRHGEEVGSGLEITTPDGVEEACRAAASATEWAKQLLPTHRADLLRACADELERIGDSIIRIAELETALGDPRLRGELGRTTGQMRFLARVVEDGSYLDVIIDSPDDGPDLRRSNRPIGPVAVFAASNFPLAFSVAGGDTVAAIAVGCPVVVKSHPAHPGTSRLVADAVSRALSACGAPAGMFAMVSGIDAGRQLVLDRRIQAVAFTGSAAAGMSLSRLAARRDLPIPVFAEMGSTNPVVVTPEASEAYRAEIVNGLAESFTLGMGQFCTKPGLIFLPAADVGRFMSDTADKLGSAGPLLSRTIWDNWNDRTESWAQHAGVEPSDSAATGTSAEDGTWATPRLLATTAAAIIEFAELREECFGPTALVVGYNSQHELLEAVAQLGGSLTGTLWSIGAKDTSAQRLSERLQDTCGRVVHNGWPTGLTVTWAMHHGGPFPATSSPAHTSVGAASIERFIRPVCLQDAPTWLLPPEVQDSNPLQIPRRVNGRYELPQLKVDRGENQ